MASASMGASAAEDAANTTAAASDRAAEVNKQMYQQTRADLAPYNNLGQSAGNRLAGIFGLGGGAGAPVGGIASPAGYIPGGPVAGSNGSPPPGAVQGTQQLGALGFTPSNTPAGLPDGYSYIAANPVGEGQGANSSFIVDRSGNLVSLVPDGVPASQVGQWYQSSQGQQQQGQPAPLQMQPGMASNAGALPGAGSSVTPYEAPWGGKFGAQTTFTPGQTTYQDYSAGPQGATYAGFNPTGGYNYKEFDPGAGGYRFAPTQANLESTPGYQFTLEQGLRATQNSAAARGLGLSGASMKGAATYATGLADNTFKTQADNFYKGLDEAMAGYGTNKANFYSGLQGQQTGYNANSANFYSGQNNALNAYNANNANFYKGLEENRSIFTDNYNRSQNAFTTNLNASTALNKQYYDYNVQPLFNLLTGGQNAAAQVGSAGTDSAKAQGNLINAGGVSQANAQLAGGSAMAGGFADAGKAGYNYLMDQSRQQTPDPQYNNIQSGQYAQGAGGYAGMGPYLGRG